MACAVPPAVIKNSAACCDAFRDYSSAITAQTCLLPVHGLAQVCKVGEHGLLGAFTSNLCT
jgi:hypothetical protein